jgi:hypothetical protein
MNFVGGAIAWRLPITAQILPAIVISVVLFGLPETPRWLIERGRIDEATEVMCQVYGAGPDDEYIVAEKAAILQALEFEAADPFRWTNILKKDRVHTGWRVWLAVLALSFNQVDTTTLYLQEAETDYPKLVVWYQRRGLLHRHSA